MKASGNLPLAPDRRALPMNNAPLSSTAFDAARSPEAEQSLLDKLRAHLGSQALQLSGVNATLDTQGRPTLKADSAEGQRLRLRVQSLELQIERITLAQLELGPAQQEAMGWELRAARVELHGMQVQAGLQSRHGGAGTPAQRASTEPTSARLEPLGQASGELHGRITDAHLFFDATLKLALQRGQIDFNDASVAHVGPDSRMGVARMGIYVDAPNGRSYLYQFASPPLAGVQYERRGALLNALVSDRGRIELQPFAQSLLRQSLGGLAQGLTAQARALLQRTSLSGELQLGDGKIDLAGLSLALNGAAQGANRLTFQSRSVGAHATLGMDRLQAQAVQAHSGASVLRAAAIEGRGRIELTLDPSPGHVSAVMDQCTLHELQLCAAQR